MHRIASALRGGRALRRGKRVFDKPWSKNSSLIGKLAFRLQLHLLDNERLELDRLNEACVAFFFAFAPQDFMPFDGIEIVPYHGFGKRLHRSFGFGFTPLGFPVFRQCFNVGDCSVRNAPIFPGLNALNMPHGIRRLIVWIARVNLRRCKQVHALDYRVPFSRPTGLSGKNQSNNPTVDGCIE